MKNHVLLVKESGAGESISYVSDVDTFVREVFDTHNEHIDAFSMDFAKFMGRLSKDEWGVFGINLHKYEIKVACSKGEIQEFAKRVDFSADYSSQESLAHIELCEEKAEAGKFYIIDRYRQTISLAYVMEYLNQFKCFDTYSEAAEHYKRACFDDSCHGIFYRTEKDEFICLSYCLK